MIKIFKNKLSIPVISGLVLAVLDLALWAWFIICAFTYSKNDSLAEGLFGMMILHFPSSLVLPLSGNLNISFSSNSLMPQFVILFSAGLAQYFFLGYLIGSVIAIFKEKFGRQKNRAEEKIDKTVLAEKNIGKAKIVIINFLYLIFAILVISMIRNYLQIAFLDFNLFKKMYPASNLILYSAVAISWLVSSFYFYRFEKKGIKQDKWNLVYIFVALLIILIFWVFINYFSI